MGRYDVRRLLQMRSSTFIFGGPVPPPYLEAICTVCDILMSSEYGELSQRLREKGQRLSAGAARTLAARPQVHAISLNAVLKQTSWRLQHTPRILFASPRILSVGPLADLRAETVEATMSFAAKPV